jgi:ribosome-associated translation inhibitor RaiA
MVPATFPIEFNNEIDDVKKSENANFAMAAEQLGQLAEGHQDITGAVVNLKLPAHGHMTPHSFEVTIVVHLGAEHIAATHTGEHLRTAMDSALDAVGRQVREYRERQRTR